MHWKWLEEKAEKNVIPTSTDIDFDVLIMRDSRRQRLEIELLARKLCSDV